MCSEYDRSRSPTKDDCAVTQRKVNVDRRKSASSVKAEIASGLGIIISEKTVLA